MYIAWAKNKKRRVPICIKKNVKGVMMIAHNVAEAENKLFTAQNKAENI